MLNTYDSMSIAYVFQDYGDGHRHETESYSKPADGLGSGWNWLHTRFDTPSE